jgi:hypothetical protein
MRIQQSSNNPIQLRNFPLIDADFDRFIQENDFETIRHSVEMESFYHDNLDPQE